MTFKFLNLTKSWMTTTCQFTPVGTQSDFRVLKILAGREGGRKPAGTQKAAKARPDSQAAGRKTKTTRIPEFDVNNALRYTERRARARQAGARVPSRALPNNNRIKPKSRRRGVIYAGGAGRAGRRAGGCGGRDQLINRGNRSGRAGAIRESIAEEKASTRAPAARQQENGERTMDPAHRRPHYDPPLHIGNRFVTIAETGGGLKIGWVREAQPPAHGGGAHDTAAERVTRSGKRYGTSSVL
ncbi:hypothetical protein B0H17DRAFT_1133051 [Mycena rosella]|uniref:Uncharacterized protein n=1 Tax=Mycena rosella TaxID=1033263 RepID=A0AAD7GJX9_MYCRO|nr:hypothetical protein B0H17DRAFT_1133051 [Mycena rosella]